jgi:TonB family protein
MSAGTTPAPSLKTTSTRKVPRYELTVPLDLTVLRSGIPDKIPGRSVEIGEGGMGVVVASQLLLGESVRVEFLLPHMSTPVRATAVVRYQRDLCCGLQFLRLPDDQQSIIRYWTRHEAEISLVAQRRRDVQAGAFSRQAVTKSTPLLDSNPSESSRSKFRIQLVLAFAVPIIVITAMLGWWQWERGWMQLEAQVPAKQAAARPQLSVPAEAMRRRLIHEVAPEYPDDARRARVQGTVVLGAVISGEGTVSQVNVVSGPEALSPAALEAVRWWRYEPYSVNGQPATVATTIAVDFRLAN